MTRSELKKVKQVDGYEVNHPFSFGNILYSLLILVLVAVPVGVLFTPTIVVNSTDVATNGLESFKFGFFDYLPYLITKQDPEIPENLFQILMLYAESGRGYEQAVLYIAVGQAAAIGLMMLMSLIGLIYFIVSIAKGYLRSAKAIKTLASFDMTFCVLFGLSVVAEFIIAQIDGFGSMIFVWWGLIPMAGMLILSIMISIVYSVKYKNVVFEADLVYHEDEEKEILMTTQVAQVHDVKKVTYEASNELPPNITSIGGHEFSQNQNLEIANIPLGIPVIGNSAFANCLNLKVVSIPNTVKEIGYNCFFNCASLVRINYAGTKEQWRHIKRGSNWLAQAKTTEVVCTDGPIVVNPYN